MQLNWHLFVIVAFIFVATILIKENSCVPSIRPSSQRGIIFPVENWDDCFLDDTSSSQPGVCKSLEECPEVLQKWEKENIYPQTCYFIKKEQFVCCPPDVANTKPQTILTIPSNGFLIDNVNLDKSTTEQPLNHSPNTFSTEKSSSVKRGSKRECVLKNQQKVADDDDDVAQPSKPNEFPFMAALGWKSSGDNKIWYPCGGVLISSRFVLTSAHCAEIGGETPSFVHLGDKNLEDFEEVSTIKIKQFIKYPGYNATSIYNDVALVELEREVKNPVACLWYKLNLPITTLTALSYGPSRLGALSSNQLFKVSLTAIDKVECQQIYKLDEKLKTMNIVDAHLCAGDLKNVHDTCQGDTGGPLIMELDKVSYVVGITTFGLGCADLPPSIYTRISSYIVWIEEIIWPEIDVRFDRK